MVQDLATAQDGADAHQQLSDSSFGSKTDGRDARSLSPTVQTDVNMDCAQLVSKVPVKSDGNAQKIGKTRRNSLTAASDPAGWYKLHQVRWLSRCLPTNSVFFVYLQALHSQLLGQGSFGQVWKAVDRDTGRPLAVKIYKPSKLKNGDIKKMVEAEIRCGNPPARNSTLTPCVCISAMFSGCSLITTHFLYHMHLYL